MATLEKGLEKPLETSQEGEKPGRGKASGSKKTQFGSPGVKPGVGPAGSKEAELEPVVVGAIDLYADMLHVRTQPKSADVTEGQRDCRKWKQTNLRTFMEKLADLETERARPVSGVPGGTPAGEDLGSLRVEELAERLLVEWEAEQAGGPPGS